MIDCLYISFMATALKSFPLSHIGRLTGAGLQAADKMLLPAAKTMLIYKDIPVSQSGINDHKAKVLSGQSERAQRESVVA